jgi:hypothetical protein
LVIHHTQSNRYLLNPYGNSLWVQYVLSVLFYFLDESQTILAALASGAELVADKATRRKG